ncbi:MAG: hypothetical protein J6Y94_00375 [Bacteriovoracaceae bacterium]|nr:hypothetical protein [Bacteriovoracaceae bacterium]
MLPSLGRGILLWCWVAAAAAQCLDHIAIGSWNTKHLGRANFSYQDASILLANLDLIALQEVNTTSAGAQALRNLQQAVGQLTHDKWCSIISPVPTDARERYAFLWRERAIALASNEAEVKSAECPQAAELAVLQPNKAAEIIREPAGAYFYAKDDQRFLYLASIHLVPTAKKPEREVPFLAQSMATQVAQDKIPGLMAMVAGDFNLASSHTAFAPWAAAGWQAALPGTVKTSLQQKQKAFSKAYDNVWWWDAERGCQMFYQVINPYQVFPTKSPPEVYREISDHAPIMIRYHQRPSNSVAEEMGRD